MNTNKLNLGKILGYPAIVLLLLTAIASAYLIFSDKSTAYSVIRVNNVTLRPPAPGQSTAAAYFDVINDGGANELLSVSTPISSKVELHTHLHEDGMMKMRMVNSVKILPKQTTHFKPMGFHVMIFNVDMADNTEQISLTLTFARPPVHGKTKKDAGGKKIDAPKIYTITVLAEIEN